jgi:N-methylhydantoinase B
MPFGLRDVIEAYGSDLHPGDIFISNEPYNTIHLSDVLITSPVFYQGRFMFHSATRAHWTDVGGSAPGSLSGKATEIHQEGVIVPPIKLYDKGKLNKEALAVILANVRLPDERRGDIRAQIAACKIGEQECIRLMDKFGPDTVAEACQEVISASENYLRNRIRELPKISAIYEDYLDNDGISDTPLRIKVKVTIAEDEIEIDFSGSSPQCRGPYNCGFAQAWTAALLALKIAFDPKGPSNQGIMKPIKLYVPDDCLLNARYPAAMGGSTDVVVRAVEVILGALSVIVPEAVPGCDFGSINHTYISTLDRASGEHRIYYSYAPGGNGGTYRMDGPGGIRGPQMGDVSLQSMEMVESMYPVVFRRFGFNCNSGGAGKFRGGMGLALDVELLTDGTLSVLSDRGKIPAYGLLGGDPGLAQDWLVSSAGKAVSLGCKVASHPLKQNDIVQVRTGGGGGYGDPLERDPEMVRQDMLDGLISLEHAAEAYGVVLNKEEMTVDVPQSEEKRRELKARRQFFTVKSYGEQVPEEIFRLVYLPASSKQFRSSELVELISSQRAAPLRAKIVLSDEIQPGETHLDEEAMDILGLAMGDALWIRTLRMPGA